MEAELQFGGVGASLIITVILMVFYNFFPDMKNKWKVLIAVLCGLGFGILKIPYDGVAWTVVNVVNNLFQGFLVGAGAIGLHQMQKIARRPRESKGGGAI